MGRMTSYISYMKWKFKTMFEPMISTKKHKSTQNGNALLLKMVI